MSVGSSTLQAIGLLNAQINGRIRYKAEPDGSDVWQTPSQTLSLKTGDCEDFAIVKYAVLTNAGIPARVVIGEIRKLGMGTRNGNVPHAWCAVCVEGRWFALDNNADRPIPVEEYPNWTPLAVCHEASVIRFGRQFSISDLLRPAVPEFLIQGDIPMTAWPKDNQTARNAFYGDPGKGEIASQMVPVVPPFAMYYTDDNGVTKRVRVIQFHRKCAAALLAALNEIWDYCQHDQARVDASGASKYFGAYNPRKVRGSATKWSNHAYAAAIDLNALNNALGVKKGTMPPFIVDAFCRQGAMWGGWYNSRPDWMHFEFVDNGGRKPKSSRPVFGAPVPIMSNPDAPADEFDDNTPAAPPVAPPVAPQAPAVIADAMVTGDPELYSVQKRLKARNYSPGVLDGVWGSGTSGALGGFINDRGGKIPVPASLDAFNAVREDIKADLGRAESEGWFRPVSAARASGDAATVATVAPEVVPARRSFLATAWAAVAAFFTAIWQALSGYVSQAWDFFTDHKDDVPTDSGFLQTAWEYLGRVPGIVWLVLAGVGLTLVALEARKSVTKITEQVKSGERQ